MFYYIPRVYDGARRRTRRFLRQSDDLLLHNIIYYCGGSMKTIPYVDRQFVYVPYIYIAFDYRNVA